MCALGIVGLSLDHAVLHYCTVLECNLALPAFQHRPGHLDKKMENYMYCSSLRAANIFGAIYIRVSISRFCSSL